MNYFLKIFNFRKSRSRRLNSDSDKISSSSVCQAPFKSLRFEPLGIMRTCCYNIQVVAGTYPEVSINEAWNSFEMNLLREKVQKRDLSYGCRLCSDQLNNGETNTVKYLQFENLPETEHNFPVMLDFSLHNTCNLECVMCHGEFSSSIRKNRENLPPMKMVYDEKFVDQLKPFIKHAKQFVFAGGEPFLIDIHYSIWDKIAKLNPKVIVGVVTNGTILNNKVKIILSKLRFNITISIDAFDEKIYEKIRINASYEKMMRNFTYFKSYCEKMNTDFTINVCPIQHNKFHLPEMIKFCNERDIKINLLYVIHPANSTLQSLNEEELVQLLNFYTSIKLTNKTFIESHNWSQYQDLIARVRGWIARKNSKKLKLLNDNLVKFEFYSEGLTQKVNQFFLKFNQEMDKEELIQKIEYLSIKFKEEELPIGRIKELESISSDRIVSLLRSSDEKSLEQTIENTIL